MIGLSLRQEISLKTELRQNLELALEQKLAHQQRLGQTLSQYLQQEGIIQGMISYADEHNTWTTFDKDKFKFTYAKLPYNIAKPIADNYGPGFCHCLNDPYLGRVRGTWTIFVVPELIPENLVDFVAIHERGEELSLGNHYFASQLEFAYAKDKSKIKSYIKFIDNKHPTKFVDLTEEVLFPVLPQELLDVLEQEKKQNSDELIVAQNLIENNPIPDMVLEKMNYYEEATNYGIELVRKAQGLTQQEIFKRSIQNPAISPDELANIVNDMLFVTMYSIPYEKARGISPIRIDEVMKAYSQNVGRDAFQKTQRQLLIPETFREAYEKMASQKRIVRVNRTVEDKNRGLI